MRLSRLLPVLAVGALTVTSVTPAAAAEPGVGSTTGALTVLGIDAGSVLDLELLTDIGGAVTDPDAGEPSAAAALSALSLTSALLGLEQEIPLLEAASTGDEDTATQDTTAVPANPLLGGALLPASLSALVGDDGAVSTIGAGIADLDVLGGLLGLTSSELDLDANALTTQADGTRTLSLDGLSVLDLEGLLAGLGIPLTDLPLDTVMGLIESLGLLPVLAGVIDQLGLPVDLDLDALLTDPVGAVTGLLGELGELPDLLLDTTALTGVCDATGTVTDPVLGLVGGLIGQDVTGVCDDVTGAVADLAAVADLQALVDSLLGDVLDSVLGVLDGTALLSLDALDVTMVTTATDSLDTSVADITATLGGLTVGDLDLGALDVLGPVGQITDVLTQVEGVLSQVLGQISPLLENLVSVNVLEEATSVTEDAGAISALASFTGLEIELAPVDVEALLASLTGGLTIGDQLTDLGLPLPDLSSILELNDVLDAAAPVTDLVTALSGGVTMQVASLSQQSTYEVLSASTPAPTPAAPAAPDPTLPRTGGDAGWLLFAGLAAVGALGIRRVVRIER